MAPTQPGQRPLWLWESAKWQWNGLTWALALLGKPGVEQPSALSQPKAAMEV